MGDLNTIYTQAKKQSIWLSEGLRKLEEAEAGQRHGDPAALARDLRTKLVDLERLSQELQSVWRMNGIRGGRTESAVWSGKISRVSDEIQSAKRALDKYQQREQRRRTEEQEREELLSHAHQLRQGIANRDAEAQIATSVTNSHRELERIYEAGMSILGNMSSNKERLKAAQRKMLDVLNSVGLGTSLLRIIERRQRLDIWITYGGMVVMLIVVALLIWFVWF